MFKENPGSAGSAVGDSWRVAFFTQYGSVPSTMLGDAVLQAVTWMTLSGCFSPSQC